MMHDLQKASLMKRISAFLIDLILIMILITGFAWVLSWATGYDQYSNTMNDEIERIKELLLIPKKSLVISK